MNESETFQRANSAALRYLSYRARSETEVRKRLRRFYPSDVVDDVIESLKKQSLINDAKFASQWTASRDANKPRSSYVLKRELASKGVARDVAEVAVEQVDDSDSAYRAGQKFSHRLYDADFEEFRRKLWGHLKRRGFNDSISRQTVFRIWQETHEDESNPPSH